MNLAFVNAAYQLGGAETVVQDLAAGCRETGHAARVYVASGKAYPPGRLGVVPLYPRLLSRAYHTRLNAFVERWAPRDKWTDREFRRLGTGWPDLVHVHNFHGDFATLDSLAHVARLKPLVWTFHGHWGITGGCDHPLDCARYQDACGECPRLGVWPLGPVDDTAAQLQAKLDVLGGLPVDVIAPSRFLARNIERSRVGRRWRVHHIPNGVSLEAFRGGRKADADLRRRLGLDPSRTTILVVNRSFRDPQKGFTTVRDAVRMLPDAGLSAVEEWLQTLHDANADARVYPPDSFRRALGRYWLAACQAAARNGTWQVWPQMLQSRLTAKVLSDASGRRGFVALPWNTARGVIRRRLSRATVPAATTL